eukprot:scaffold84032_cov63-Phaeocystis_antarctica.AAC.1
MRPPRLGLEPPLRDEGRLDPVGIGGGGHQRAPPPHGALDELVAVRVDIDLALAQLERLQPIADGRGGHHLQHALDHRPARLRLEGECHLLRVRGR